MLELTWLVPGDWSSYKEETRVKQILEEKYNVDIEVIAINAWDEEKVNVTLASGTYPNDLSDGDIVIFTKIM